MVAIKDMEISKDCKKCPLMGTDGNPKDLLNPMMCVAIWATTHKIKHCVGGKILDDCPLVEVKAIPLDKVKQAGEEIENQVKFWGEPSKYNVKPIVAMRNAKVQSYKHCLEILDKLIESEG